MTTEKQMLLKEQGDEAAAAANASEEIIYRIDIPANRHDLLCLEGLTTSLLIFQNKYTTLISKLKPYYHFDDF